MAVFLFAFFCLRQSAGNLCLGKLCALHCQYYVNALDI